jgi:hypothetical protein
VKVDAFDREVGIARPVTLGLTWGGNAASRVYAVKFNYHNHTAFALRFNCFRLIQGI